MRYAVIIAGGSGTRLWPMSRAALPKQLIPLFDGRCLLQIADDRLQGLVPPQHRYICAGQSHHNAILDALPAYGDSRYLGEPTGRDTLNAVGFAAAVIAKQDPEAVIGVFTADHIIEPADRFRQIVTTGYQVVESDPQTLVTFGITPTEPATGFGYLELGPRLPGDSPAHVVARFKEKPDPATAQQYLVQGPEHYLWNSGMFVWRADTLLDCIRRYAPENHRDLQRIAAAWGTDQQQTVLEQVYPQLPKTSVDFAVMEPASTDPLVRVAAVPMPLRWLDVGSWPAFAKTCPTDDRHNALAAHRHLLMETDNTLVASSDREHLIATIGCKDLIIIHTPEATLVCPADRAEQIKQLHTLAGQKLGPGVL